MFQGNKQTLPRLAGMPGPLEEPFPVEKTRSCPSPTRPLLHIPVIAWLCCTSNGGVEEAAAAAAAAAAAPQLASIIASMDTGRWIRPAFPSWIVCCLGCSCRFRQWAVLVLLPVHCGAVRCGAGAVLCCAALCCAVLCGAVRCGAVRCGAVLCCAVSFSGCCAGGSRVCLHATSNPYRASGSRWKQRK